MKEAHTFRENVLKVQASFEENRTTPNCDHKRKRKEDAFETEFVPVYVKEEKEAEIAEEKEMNVVDPRLYCKKEGEDTFEKEINVLDIRPNEENNALEDTKTSITEDRISSDGNITDGSSFNEEDIEADVEYTPNAHLPKKTKNKVNKKRFVDKTTNNTRDVVEIDINIPPKKGSTSRRRRKDQKDNQNLFICDKCGNHFTCRHHFKLHLRRHTGDKQCACE